MEDVFSPKKTGLGSFPLAYIRPNRAQPRRTFSEEELHGLAESIRENGVLQPLSVRRVAQNEYELVAGERRLRAARWRACKPRPASSSIATTVSQPSSPCWKIFSAPTSVPLRRRRASTG